MTYCIECQALFLAEGDTDRLNPILSVLNRVIIVSTAAGLLSTSSNLRSSACAATPVVPLPAKKSITRSPGLDDAATILSRI